MSLPTPKKLPPDASGSESSYTTRAMDEARERRGRQKPPDFSWLHEPLRALDAAKGKKP